MGRASETRHNKVQSTTMAKKKFPTRTLLKKKKQKYEDKNGFSGILKENEDLRAQILAGKGGNPDCASQSINAIDFISFWFCLIIFILFNIAYWNYYIGH